MSMSQITFNCTIQEGMIADALRPRLAAEPALITTDSIGGGPDAVAVHYIGIPYGFGFRGGQQ